jgi:peptidoglycan/LPS O-acetylase OafA/YrhL
MKASPGTRSDGHLPVLDGLRAISIGLVMVGHALGHRYRAIWPSLGESADQMAYFGVNVFFVISGYLITLLLLREECRTGGIDLRSFYARRVLRIIPASYTFIMVVAVLSAAGLVSEFSTRDIILSLAYLRNLAGHNLDTAHLWSLSLEEQFYLIWPGVLIAVVARSRRLATFWASLAGFAAWRAAMVVLGRVGYSQLYMRPDLRMDTILVGCGLALLAGGPRFERMSRSAFERPWFAAMTVVALIAWLGWGARLPYVGVVLWTVTATLTAAMVHWLLRNPDAPGVRLLQRPGVQLVGRLSYSLYLWQQLFLFSTSPIPLAHRFPFDFLLTIACALTSYYVVERPFLALKDRYFRTRRGPDALVVPAGHPLTPPEAIATI